MKSKKRSPHDIDIGVGQTIRTLRIARGISQTDLASTIGVSFQQVQKYEKGTNRVSASRLAQIADVLDCTIADLYAGLKSANGRLSINTSDPGRLFLASAEGQRIASAWPKIHDKARNSILSLIESVAA